MTDINLSKIFLQIHLVACISRT